MWNLKGFCHVSPSLRQILLLLPRKGGRFRRSHFTDGTLEAQSGMSDKEGQCGIGTGPDPLCLQMLLNTRDYGWVCPWVFPCCFRAQVKLGRPRAEFNSWVELLGAG